MRHPSTSRHSYELMSFASERAAGVRRLEQPTIRECNNDATKAYEAPCGSFTGSNTPLKHHEEVRRFTELATVSDDSIGI